KSLFPGGFGRVEYFVESLVLAAHHRWPKTECHVNLFGDAVEAGAKKYIGRIHQQFTLGLGVQLLVVLHEAGQISETCVIKQQDRLSRNATAYKTLADT